MSTAEITFSIGELASDRKQEGRKILWALLAALVIHLIIGFVLALVSAVQTTPFPEEESPVELTIIDNSPVTPKVPDKLRSIVLDESKESAQAPKEKQYEANVNSVAASEAAAAGDKPLPSQDGKERAWMDLDNTEHTQALEGSAPAVAMPQPSTAPQPTAAPKPESSVAPAQTPAPSAAPDQFAMLTTRPTPVDQPQQPTPAPQPAASARERPNSAYRPLKQKTQIGGNISNRGISSVNAMGTPLGRYQKIVDDAVGSHWYAYVDSKNDIITIGTLIARFVVDRSGQIKNLRIVTNTSNEAFANVCLRSIMDAKLPPIPDDVAATLPPEGLQYDEMTFTMYPNR
jgi:outer membrane biosynthesis protein TonB